MIEKITILAWMAIPLTQGLFALVDGDDYERLSRHKWCADKMGNTYYAMRHTPTQNGKRGLIYMHRVILGLSKGVQTDHRNGYGLDNRKTNLRPATSQQNQFNQCNQHRKKSSRYKGVFWHKEAKKWRAQIRFNNKQISLGMFDDEIEAAKAYGKAAKRLFGEFARTNF